MKVSVLKWFYCVHPYYKNYDIMILDLKTEFTKNIILKTVLNRC